MQTFNDKHVHKHTSSNMLAHAFVSGGKPIRKSVWLAPHPHQSPVGVFSPMALHLGSWAPLSLLVLTRPDTLAAQGGLLWKQWQACHHGGDC